MNINIHLVSGYIKKMIQILFEINDFDKCIADGNETVNNICGVHLVQST